jgi:hypothetical protein
MAGWGNTTDRLAAGNVDLGANNTPFRFKGGTQPEKASQAAEKRNVIMTDNGFVRRQQKTDSDGNVRTIDEMLIPLGGLAADAGFPNITEIFTSANSTSGVTTANSANVYVVFSEPVFFGDNAANLTLTLANTAGGNHHVAICNTSVRDVIGANNTLVFKVAGGFKGTYQVNSQSIVRSGGSANLNSLNTSAGVRSANLTISGAVSNNLSTFAM